MHNIRTLSEVDIVRSLPYYYDLPPYSVLGCVHDLILPLNTFRRAVYGALGCKGDIIVVDSEWVAEECIHFLNNRRRSGEKIKDIKFLALSNCQMESDDDCRKMVQGMQGIHMASDVVAYKESLSGVVEFLLGNTIIAEKINQGRHLQRLFQGEIKVVDMHGNRIATNDIMVRAIKEYKKRI